MTEQTKIRFTLKTFGLLLLPILLLAGVAHQPQSKT